MNINSRKIAKIWNFLDSTEYQSGFSGQGWPWWTNYEPPYKVIILGSRGRVSLSVMNWSNLIFLWSMNSSGSSSRIFTEDEDFLTFMNLGMNRLNCNTSSRIKNVALLLHMTLQHPNARLGLFRIAVSFVRRISWGWTRICRNRWFNLSKKLD